MKCRSKYLMILHILLAILLVVILWAPKQRPNLEPCTALLAAIALIELGFLRAIRRSTSTGPYDIVLLTWCLFLIWEICTSVCHIAHPVLIPAPENVFATFVLQWKTIVLNVLYSLQLLAIGFTIGMGLAVVLGLYAGWYPRLRAFAQPIANVMAPIPAIVLSPYLVALMPTFRAASVVVIVLGVFWPTFLKVILQVSGMDRSLLDSARMLRPSNATMIWRILLPYIFPGLISGLKISMATSFLMLNYAELMGATHGMGYYVQNSITYANYTHAVAGILIIGLVVTLIQAALTRLQAALHFWN